MRCYQRNDKKNPPFQPNNLCVSVCLFSFFYTLFGPLISLCTFSNFHSHPSILALPSPLPYFTFIFYSSFKPVQARAHARSSSISNAISHTHYPFWPSSQLIYRHDIKSNGDGGGGGGVDMTVSHLFNVIALCACAVGK